MFWMNMASLPIGLRVLATFRGCQLEGFEKDIEALIKKSEIRKATM